MAHAQRNCMIAVYIHCIPMWMARTPYVLILNTSSIVKFMDCELCGYEYF